MPLLQGKKSLEKLKSFQHSSTVTLLKQSRFHCSPCPGGKLREDPCKNKKDISVISGHNKYYIFCVINSSIVYYRHVQVNAYFKAPD